MPKMKSNFRGLVTLLAKNLYPEADAFVRELIQNAHDGIQLRCARDPEHAGEIQVTVDREARTVTFTDNGPGMDRFVIEEFLSTIGSSGTGTMTAELRQSANIDVATIGQFGIGLLSAFVVAERVDVYTRHGATGEAWHWVNTGDDEYTLEPTSEMPHVGTQVIAAVHRDFTEFLDEERIEGAIRKHADLLPVPIFLNGRGPVNAVRPPWEVAAALPHSQREEYLTQYLSNRYRDFPLLVIPVQLPALRTQGLLYVTDQRVPGIGTSGCVDLFQNRMSIRPRDTELLPEWARFVRGIIDSRDLQPTAARDNVHRNAAYQALRRALGERIIETILRLSEESPAYFARLAEWHHFHLKGIALQDDRVFDRLILRLPFETSEGSLTLDAYRKRAATPAGAPTAVYYFTDEADAARFYEICRMRNLIAISAGKCFEEELLHRLVARHPAEWTLRKLDTLESEELYARLPDEQAEAFGPLLDAVRAALDGANLKHVSVGIRRFEPARVCSALIEDPRQENCDRLRFLLHHPFVQKGLDGLSAAMDAELDEQPRVLLLNAANPLVVQLAQRETALIEGARPAMPSSHAEDTHPSSAASRGPTATATGTALLGLYFSALLHSKGRLSASNAQAIHNHLTEALEQMLLAEASASRAARQNAALRRVLRGRTESLSGEDWAAAAAISFGRSPAEFRERVARASDEELARLMLGMLSPPTSAP
ncbi:MAG TPA: ATP-binding protein [Verrucomicrobiae bacterium]|nr:ATP-binding protein [Verrucomicrobiae bacterium]